MKEFKTLNYFKAPFIDELVIVPETLPFSDAQLTNFDNNLNKLLYFLERTYCYEENIKL